MQAIIGFVKAKDDKNYVRSKGKTKSKVASGA